MHIDRIVVGYDGSGPSRAALAWAVREATRTRAIVRVVTTWAPASSRPPEVAAIAARRRKHQATAIRSALGGVPSAHRPVVVGSVVMADPVTALADAAADADPLVIGSGPRTDGLADRLTARLARWPRRYGGPCPVRTVRTLITTRIQLKIHSSSGPPVRVLNTAAGLDPGAAGRPQTGDQVTPAGFVACCVGGP
jgi:nucleotide-binding universal stress UspA family protein